MGVEQTGNQEQHGVYPGVDTSRRRLLKLLVLSPAIVAAPALLLDANVGYACSQEDARSYIGEVDVPTASELPRWRGFNLIEKQDKGWSRPYSEWDFDFMANFGFDFVRLPLDYRIFTKEDALGVFLEQPLKEIDQTIEWGRDRGIHTCLSFHRAPGWTIAQPQEALNLFADKPGAEDVHQIFASYWRMFAERYKGIPSRYLSFNLVNEPITAPEVYIKAITPAISSIKEVDPQRLVVADGINGGAPVLEMASLDVAQSTRGYVPFELTHYQVPWVNPGEKGWPEPTWPIQLESNFDWWPSYWDRNALSAVYGGWRELAQKRVGIMVGEWGVWHKVPHHVSLAWMRDMVSVFNQEGWGWALYNLRGPFGVVDSTRNDVRYEDYKGHNLDRKMLEVLNTSSSIANP